MRKSLIGLTAVALAVGVLVWSTQARPPRPRNHTIESAENPSTFAGAHVSTGLLIESTGFESGDGWNLGFICDPGTFTNCLGPPLPALCTGDPATDGNCCADNPNPATGWYLSISSEHCKEPHIDTDNPATGEQHIRFVNDPNAGVPAGCVGTGGACRITAFTPTIADPGAVPHTISYNIAMGGASGQPPFGSTFTMWFLPAAGNGDSHYFNYYGIAYFYDYGIGGYYIMGYMAGDGAYDRVIETRDPCNDVACYDFNGAVICQSAGMSGMSGSIVRLIMLHDNNIYPWDIDDYSIVRGDPCPTFCDGVELEAGEECDHGAGMDANCPGRCIAAGEALECTCEKIGTFEEPTVAVNGANGPFYSHSGFFKYTADTPYTSIHTCDTPDLDTVLWFEWDETAVDFIFMNDECDDSYDGPPDPSAPCYNGSYPPGSSCLTVPTTVGETYLFAIGAYPGVVPPPLGSELNFTISKKTGPGEPIPNGACCDTLVGTCADNVPIDNCDGEWLTWTENKTCDLITCDPDGGACCDMSPGNGGACVDDVTSANCPEGEQQSWSKGALCADVGCAEATGACCDSLYGTCVDGMLQVDCACPQCGWFKETDCANVVCMPVPGACCNHDDGTCTSTTTMDCDCEKCEWTKGAGCGEVNCDANFTPIPTVSEWGLAILALLLLTGAKVYFGRRQAATA